MNFKFFTTNLLLIKCQPSEHTHIKEQFLISPRTRPYQNQVSILQTCKLNTNYQKILRKVHRTPVSSFTLRTRQQMDHNEAQEAPVDDQQPAVLIDDNGAPDDGDESDEFDIAESAENQITQDRQAQDGGASEYPPAAITNKSENFQLEFSAQNFLSLPQSSLMTPVESGQEQRQLSSIASFGFIQQQQKQQKHGAKDGVAGQPKLIISENANLSDQDNKLAMRQVAYDQAQENNNQQVPVNGGGAAAQGGTTPPQQQTSAQKKSRIKSHGFGEQAMAAIEAANGLLPQNSNTNTSGIVVNDSAALAAQMQVAESSMGGFSSPIKPQFYNQPGAVTIGSDDDRMSDISGRKALHAISTGGKSSPTQGHLMHAQAAAGKNFGTKIQKQISQATNAPALLLKEQIKFHNQNNSSQKGSAPNQSFRSSNMGNTRGTDKLNLQQAVFQYKNDGQSLEQLNPALPVPLSQAPKMKSMQEQERVLRPTVKALENANAMNIQNQSQSIPITQRVLNSSEKSHEISNQMNNDEASNTMGSAAYMKPGNDFGLAGAGVSAQGPGFAAIQNQTGFGMGFYTKRSHNQGHNFTLRSQSSQNSGGGFANIIGTVGTNTQGTHSFLQGLGAGQGSYRAVDNMSGSQNKSPEIAQRTMTAANGMPGEDQQDPYAFYLLGQGQQVNKAITNETTPGQINVKNQQMRKLGFDQLGGERMNDNDASGVESMQEMEVGMVKSCRPNLYNQHHLIISQRGAGVNTHGQYQLALLANKNSLPQSINNDMSSSGTYHGHGLATSTGGPGFGAGLGGFPGTIDGRTPTQDLRHRQQSLDQQQKIFIQEMQPSTGRLFGLGGGPGSSSTGTAGYVVGQGVGGTQHFQLRGMSQKKSLDLQDSNQKSGKSNSQISYLQQQQQQIMSPGGSTTLVMPNQIGNDSRQFRRIFENNEKKILSGVADARAGLFTAGTNIANYYDHYQNQSMTSNNERGRPMTGGAKMTSKGLMRFIGSAGSGSHGSQFNSSVSTFPAAPIQKLSDIKNPQKLLTLRFVNRKASKLAEISLFKNLRELDLSGNMLQEEVQELNSLNFLKNLNLSYNKITSLWTMPKRVEILNLSNNLIKYMSEEVCKSLRNVTTIDISNNKLESFENFQHMVRIKRLVAKNNHVRLLAPMKNVDTIYELDLEGNAVDSHIDFLEFIKGKNDLIVVNLQLNPIMVEVDSIEKLNDDLLQKAPDIITRKTDEEIDEYKELMGLNKDKEAPAPAPSSMSLINQSSEVQPQNLSHEEKNNSSTQRLSGAGAQTAARSIRAAGSNGNVTTMAVGDDTCHLNLHLINELANCLTYLKNGVLYRNKRVYAKIRQIQMQQAATKRSISNYSNSSNSAIAAGGGTHAPGATGSTGRIAGMNKVGLGAMASGSNPPVRVAASGHGAVGQSSVETTPHAGGAMHNNYMNNKSMITAADSSSQGNKTNSASIKMSPIDQADSKKTGVPAASSSNWRHQKHVNSGFVVSHNAASAHNNLHGPGKHTKNNNLSSSIGHSPILSKKSCRFEDIENLYEQIVEQEELKKLKQQKLFAKRRKQKKKQMMSQLEKNPGASQQFQSSEDSHSSYEFSDGSDLDDDEDLTLDDGAGYPLPDDLDNSQDVNAHISHFIDRQNPDDMLMEQSSSVIVDQSYFQNQYQQNLHDDDAVSQTITSDLDPDLHLYKRVDYSYWGDLDNLYDGAGGVAGQAGRPRGVADNRTSQHDDEHLNGSTAGFGKKLRQINMEIKQEQLDSLEKGTGVQVTTSKPSASHSVLESPATRQTDDHPDLVVKSGARLMHHPPHHSLSAQKEKLKDLQAPSDDPFMQAKKVPQKKIKTRLNLDLLNLNKINIQNGTGVNNALPGQHMRGAIKVGDDEAQMTEHKEQSHRISQDIKIEPALLEHGKRKQTKTVQNSNESSHDEVNSGLKQSSKDVQMDQMMGGVRIGTITHSSDKMQPNDQQQTMNQSFSLKNLPVGADGSQLEVESLMMNRIERGPQAPMFNEFSAQNDNYAAYMLAAGQNISLQSLRPDGIGTGSASTPKGAMATIAGINNLNTQKHFNSIMQASLSQNIEAPDFLRLQGAAGGGGPTLGAAHSGGLNSNPVPHVNQSEKSNYHNMLDDSMAVHSGGLSFTQNSKKNMHHNFKLDLSKCVNEDGEDFVMSVAVDEINHQIGGKKDKKKKAAGSSKNKHPVIKQETKKPAPPTVSNPAETPSHEDTSEPIDLDKIFIEDVSTSNRLQMIPSSRRAKMLKQKNSEPTQQQSGSDVMAPGHATDKSIRIISRDGNGHMSPKIAKKTIKKLEQLQQAQRLEQIQQQQQHKKGKTMTERVPSQMLVKKLSLSNVTDSEISQRDRMMRFNYLQLLLSRQTTLAAIFGGLNIFKVFFKIMMTRPAAMLSQRPSVGSSSWRYSNQAQATHCSNCVQYQNALLQMQNMSRNDMKVISGELDRTHRLLQEVKATCANLQQINLIDKLGSDSDAVSLPSKTVRQIHDSIEKLNQLLANFKAGASGRPMNRGHMIKIPNIDQITAKVTDKRNKIPQPPKTVTCRQANATVQGGNALLVKRKSLDRTRAGAGIDGMNVSAIIPSSTSGGMSGVVALVDSGSVDEGKGRNAANTMQNSLVMRQFMQKKNFSSHHTQEIGGLRGIPTTNSGAGTTEHGGLDMDQDGSTFSQHELDSVQRLAYEAVAASANLSAATGPGARTEGLLRSGGGPTHDSSLERPQSLIKSAGGAAGAQFAQLQQQLLESGAGLHAGDNSNLISIESNIHSGSLLAAQKQAMGTKTGNASTSGLASAVAAGYIDRDYEPNSFTVLSNNFDFKQSTSNRNGSGAIGTDHLISRQEREAPNSSLLLHQHPALLSQMTSLQSSSVQLNDKKLIIQKQQMLPQGQPSTRTQAQHMQDGTGQLPQGYGNQYAVLVSKQTQKKLKSQRYNLKTQIQQNNTIANYTNNCNLNLSSGASAHQTNGQQSAFQTANFNSQGKQQNVQLAKRQTVASANSQQNEMAIMLQQHQQSIMAANRNKSNTSRGMKGSAQYQQAREQLFNFNQTSQSSINPKNYFTTKRKSPKQVKQYGSGQRKTPSGQQRARHVQSRNGNGSESAEGERHQRLAIQNGRQGPNAMAKSYGMSAMSGCNDIPATGAGSQQLQMASATRGGSGMQSGPRGVSQQHSTSQQQQIASAQYAIGLLDYSGKASSQNKKVSSRKMQRPVQASQASGAQSLAQVTPSATGGGTSKKRQKSSAHAQGTATATTTSLSGAIAQIQNINKINQPPYYGNNVQQNVVPQQTANALILMPQPQQIVPRAQSQSKRKSGGPNLGGVQSAASTMAAGTVITATAGTQRKPQQQNQLILGPNHERKAASKPAESRGGVGVARGPRFALQLQPKLADGKYLQNDLGAVSFEMPREKLLGQNEQTRAQAGTGRGKSADRKSHSKTAMARKSNRQDPRAQPPLLMQNNWCEGGNEELESQTQQQLRSVELIAQQMFTDNYVAGQVTSGRGRVVSNCKQHRGYSANAASKCSTSSVGGQGALINMNNVAAKIFKRTNSGAAYQHSPPRR